MMTNRERGFIVVVLAILLVFLGFDLISDSREGARGWHLAVEAAAAVAAAVGIYVVLRDVIRLKNTLATERKTFSDFQVEAELWRAQSKKYVDGLSQAIDTQLTSWSLTDSEKEVALLLLKGLSLKEVAEIRKTTEKTARAQSIAIYSKAGLAGRSELSAFFLEDLLTPKKI